MMPPTLKELKVLRKYGHVPRLHGNGFLQFDLDKAYRLHIWSPDLPPAQKVSTQIHDHIWHFESKVLLGELVDCTYEGNILALGIGEEKGRANDRHPMQDIYQVYETAFSSAGGHNTKLIPVRHFLHNIIAHARRVTAGNRYAVAAGNFHQTMPQKLPLMTIIRKDPEHLTTRARVLVPLGVKPDNAFDRHAADVDQLWHVLEETLRDYHAEVTRTYKAAIGMV